MQGFHYKALPVEVFFDLGKSAQVQDILLEQGYRGC